MLDWVRERAVRKKEKSNEIPVSLVQPAGRTELSPCSRRQQQVKQDCEEARDLVLNIRRLRCLSVTQMKRPSRQLGIEVLKAERVLSYRCKSGPQMTFKAMRLHI